ncbi:uncharacterized protein EV154DRAFT_598922 [Mucor mucedo]|uniref:uncharacterized protein n=1 Tax=Mucor mucedo TaxID=29922 RepID=UPI00221E8D36|nr:uncharacterized protein EV154DRAFT_598922 [Mucor mucedo]KAI7895983.1 hypothetical protein EV154DRAFT_598922 [Mucor mucedo]
MARSVGIIKHKSMISVLLALLSFGSNVSSETILGRSFPSCGYVGGQIYCVGGDTNSDFSGGYKIDQNLYSLDVAQFLGKEINTLNDQWKVIVPATSFSFENRRAPISIVLPDEKKLMIVSGYHTAFNQKLSNQTIIYDTVTNTWEKSISYVEEGRGTRQIFHSTAVNLPDNTIGFYGGLEQVANTTVPEVSTSGQIMNYTSDGQSFVGFRSIVKYSPGLKNWSGFTPQTNVPADYYPNSQSATIDPSTGKVYFFGGSYYSPFSNGSPTRVPFHTGYTFNTKSGGWAEEKYGGEFPTERMFHSTNLLPNSNDIILYGGSNDGAKASTDYCYTLSLSSNKWTKQNLNFPTSVSGPRFSHSALVVNSTLFILFGRGPEGNLIPSMLGINVANASNVTYTSIYNANVPKDMNNTNITSDRHTDDVDEAFPKSTPAESPTEIESNGLSKGAIGGIAAGCVILVLALIIFGIFYLRRQKKARHDQQKNDMIDDEQIHVDWDKIDQEYREVSASSSPKTSDRVSSTNATKVNGSPLLSETNPLQDVQRSNNKNVIKSPDAPEIISVKPSMGNTYVKPDVQIR